MNPADLTLPGASPNLGKQSLAVGTGVQKPGKAPVPRVDIEPIYTQLKSALGDQWTEYKASINAFILGKRCHVEHQEELLNVYSPVGSLNQAELDWVLHPLFLLQPSSSPANDNPKPHLSILLLHNALLVALLANISRDAPPSDIAYWVASTDKPSTLSKSLGTSGVNDQTEERLKRETMTLHARDRRRIKAIKETNIANSDVFREMQGYLEELSIRSLNSSVGPTKSSWDLESRRRYAQPLASETLEFPAQGDIHNRIEPICNEEGLGTSAQTTIQACAEMIEQAAEVFLKELLGQLYSHFRSNGDGLIYTSKYGQQLLREECDAERGTVQRSVTGMLPIEIETHANREPMGMNDVRLAVMLQDQNLRRDPFFIARSIFDGPLALLPQTFPSKGSARGAHVTTNGWHDKFGEGETESSSAIDDESYWTGAEPADRNDLLGVLDDCLAIG